jgi:hypothetical protein
MRTLTSLALACAVLCCGCSTLDAAPEPAKQEAGATTSADSGALYAEPRGFVGETCPPALAAKGYC